MIRTIEVDLVVLAERESVFAFTGVASHRYAI